MKLPEGYRRSTPISRVKYGNCLFVALLAKARDPRNVRLHRRGRFARQSVLQPRLSFPHWYWEDKNTRALFSFQPVHASASTKIAGMLWYEGQVCRLGDHGYTKADIVATMALQSLREEGLL